jgi:DNA polymerase
VKLVRHPQSKLEPMLAGASQQDQRLRGCFQYSGANTRRWAGRRVQLHNLKRPTIKQTVIDQVLKLLPQGIKAHEIDALYGPPLDVLSNCIRGFLVAAPGTDLITCDFSSIEARVLAWLARETTTLEIFKTHGRIYEHAAGNIFGTGLDSVNESQRQVGKVAVLALGYQGGVGALQTMARGYGVQLAPVYAHLWKLADDSQREWVEKAYKQNKSKYDDISREEYIASDLTKTFWRQANPNIVSYWADVGECAIRAVEKPMEKIKVKNANIAFLVNGSFLWCKLPSGGVICYPYPQIQDVELPWGGKTKGLTYMAEDGQSKKWMRFKTYGGSLVENITQAVARDLLADAMLRLEDKGYPIVAHVHDEVVCELKEREGSLEEMSQIMCDSPAWANGLPVKAGGWRGKRYRK